MRRLLFRLVLAAALIAGVVGVGLILLLAWFWISDPFSDFPSSMPVAQSTPLTQSLREPDPSWLSSPATGSESDLVFAIDNPSREERSGPTRQAVVYALDAVTGAERWRVTTSGPVNGSPVVSGGAVYVSDDGGTLHAIDADTGQVGWRFVLGSGRGLGAPAVADGLVFVPTAGAPGSLLRAFAKPGTVYALDAMTGVERWRFTAERAIGGSPAVTNGMVFITASEDGLYSLDGQTGEQRWLYPATGGITEPVALGNRVFVVMATGGWHTALVAFDAATGAHLWSEPTGNSDIAASVAGDTVYVATGRTGEAHPYAGVLALDAATGQERWYYVTDGSVHALAAAGDSVALSSGICREPVYDWFTACMQGWVAGIDGLDPATGDFLWRFRTDEPFSAPIQMTADLVCIDDGEGTLWALDRATGEQRWHFTV